MMDKKYIVSAVFASLIFFSILSNLGMAYTIQGDLITWESDLGKITQEPHTLTGITNYPVINFTSKFSTPQVLDIALGFNVPDAIPKAALWYNPRYEDVSRSYTCEEYFNYTLSPKHFWCWHPGNSTYTLIYDHDFDTGNLTAKTAYWNDQIFREWQDISGLFSKQIFNYDNKNTWYLIQGVSFNPGETKTIKIQIDIKPGSSGKYDIFIKRNSESLADSISGGNYILLDPWFNTTYAKCRNITLTESSGVARTNELVYSVFSLGAGSFQNTNDIHLVNSSCNNGGSELPFILVGNNSSAINITYRANVSASGSAVYSLYYNGTGAPHPNITDVVAWYPNISNLLDRSGNGFTLTRNNANCSISGWRSGYGACNFTGTDNSLTQATLLDVNYSQISIIIGLKLYTAHSGASSGYWNTFTKRNTNSPSNHLMGQFWDVDGSMAERKWFNSASETRITSDVVSFLTSNYYSIAYLCGSSTQKMFINGTQQSSTNANTNCMMSGTAQDFTLGNDLDYTAQYLRGWIDMALVLNSTPTSSELSSYVANTALSASLGSEESATSPTSITLTINGASANASHSYTPLTGDNLTAVINTTGLWIAILDNSTLLSNGTTSTTITQVMGGGLHNITAYWPGNGSYDSSSATYWLNISQAPNDFWMCIENRTSNYCIDTNFTIGSITAWHYDSSDIYETYPNQFRITYGGNKTPISNATLNYKNSTEKYFSAIPNNSWITLNATNPTADKWSLWYNVSSNANYSANYSWVWLDVFKGTPVMNITFNTSSTITAGTPVLITCNYPAELSATLANDTGPVSNPLALDTTSLLGTYNYTCSAPANANYSAGSATPKNLTILGASGLTINVYNEANTSQELTFDITINNGTASDTKYNQSNPYTNSSLLGLLTIDISASGYGARTYYITAAPAGSVNLSAYLLPDALGSWCLNYVYSPFDQPIEAALINIERLVPPASYLTIAQKKTDISGSASIFLDPTITYRFNISATNYQNKSFTLQPAACPYVIYMNFTSSLSYNSSFKNIYWQVRPEGSALLNETTAFNFTISALDSDLNFWGLNITAANGTALYFNNSTAAAGGSFTPSIDLSSYNSSSILLRAFFKKAGYDIYYFDRTYYVYDTITPANTSLIAAADYLASSGTMPEFAFGIISLFIVLIVMGLASKEFSYAGSGVLGLAALAVLTYIGIRIYGVGYWLGWNMLFGIGLAVVGMLYLRSRL